MFHSPSVPSIRKIVGAWPWMILALSVLPALYRVLDYPSDIDPEYPRVLRPVFNRLPPLAYRLAEPGDRLDQAAVWLAAVAIATAVRGLLASKRRGQGVGLWPAALATAMAAFWYSAIPTPMPDGWHGLGWASIADPSAPWAQRLFLAGVAIGLVVIATLSIRHGGVPLGHPDAWGMPRGDVAMLAVGLILVGFRLAGIPAIEPDGYWPRWALVWGLLACDLALIRAIARRRHGAPGLEGGRRWIGPSSWAAACIAVGALGIAVGWYHRPLDRFKAVDPGKIYISAMPTDRGLELAHRRHRFKTIINLFPEDGPWRSPLLPEELKFAREHGIRYVANPGETPDPTAFIERTLAVARDPQAWPILVHCHACYDRTPAWVGIYRFVVQGRPLDGILREMEGHRGSRPKASVTLLYDRVLPTMAPARSAEDPTARLLRGYAAGGSAQEAPFR